MKTKFKKGFTFTEVLVVVTMMAILSGVVFVNISSVQKKARDEKRIQDMKLIQTYLERYYSQHGRYPDSDSILNTESPFDAASDGGCGGWDIGNSNHTFIKRLATFLGVSFVLPIDSTFTDTCSGYFYYRYSPSDSAWYGCPGGKPFYVLGANVESSSYASSSPGWSCSGRNWQGERTWWVTGKYE